MYSKMKMFNENDSGLKAELSLRRIGTRSFTRIKVLRSLLRDKRTLPISCFRHESVHFRSS